MKIDVKKKVKKSGEAISTLNNKSQKKNKIMNCFLIDKINLNGL